MRCNALLLVCCESDQGGAGKGGAGRGRQAREGRASGLKKFYYVFFVFYFIFLILY